MPNSTYPVPSDSVSVVVDGWNIVLGASEGFGYSRGRLCLGVHQLDQRLLDSVTSDRNPRKAA